jgi:hypothetical protein
MVLLASPSSDAAATAKPPDVPQILTAQDIASVRSVDVVTLTGRPVVALRYVDVGDDCSSRPESVSIATPAYHGIVDVNEGSLAPRDPVLPNVRALARCGAAAARTHDVIYRPDPGYAGRDQFDIEVHQGKDEFKIIIGIGVVAKAGDVPPAAMDPTDDSLPAGTLLGVSKGRGGAFFIDLDHSRVNDGIATVRIYTVFEPAYQLKGKEVVQEVRNSVIDCVHRTYIEHRAFAFDEAGDQVIWTSGNRVETIPPNNALDFIARVMCDGVRLPPEAYVRGHAAALARGRAAIRKSLPPQ